MLNIPINTKMALKGSKNVFFATAACSFQLVTQLNTLPMVFSDLKSVRNFLSYDPVKLRNKHIFQIFFQFFKFSIKSKMAARQCFLLDKILYHSLATIKFDIWLKFCSNRSIISFTRAQKLLIGR